MDQMMSLKGWVAASGTSLSTVVGGFSVVLGMVVRLWSWRQGALGLEEGRLGLVVVGEWRRLGGPLRFGRVGTQLG